MNRMCLLYCKVLLSKYVALVKKFSDDGLNEKYIFTSKIFIVNLSIF